MVASGSKREWRATLVVPASAPAGPAELHAEVVGQKSTEASGTLSVDNKLPIETATLDPSRPVPHQYVRVRMRFLADVKPGMVIHWEDGAQTRLDRPITGRVYQFSVKVNFLPYRGFLLIGGTKLPITLK